MVGRPDLKVLPGGKCSDEDRARMALWPERYRNVHALPITRPVPAPPGPKSAA